MAWQATIKNPRGKTAENAALVFLKKRGLSLVERNFAFSGGEIDLIMEEGNTIVFCEVRYRGSVAFGGASASITYEKKLKLARTATYYLQNRRLVDKHPCRFDVLAVSPNTKKNNSNLSIHWIKNAFDV